MKPNYYEIYNEIRLTYRNQFDLRSYPWRRFRGGEESALDSLEGMIFEVEEKIDKRLRPDARIFLLSNFHLMVLMPLSHRLAPDRAKEINDAVRGDLFSIVSTAADYAKGEPEISGGAILRATSQLWNELKINAQNIWT